MADPTKLTRVPVTMMDSIPVEEATVDTVGGVKLGSLETLIAGDDEGRVVPQSLVRQLLGHELEWKRLPYQNVSLPSTALPSFGNGRMMMSWYNSSTTQMFVADNRGETILPRTAVTALAHQAANYSPRWGNHVFMSNSTSFRWTYDGDTWTIATVSYAPTNMGLAATCVTRNGQAMFFAANYFYLHSAVATISSNAWSSSWTGSTAAAHNDATGSTVALGYGTTTNGAYIMRAANDTTTFTRTLALPFAMTQANSHKLTCGNGIFVGIVTGTNCVFWSTDDGVTWTTKGLPDGVFAQDIAFGDGKFVIATPYNCNYVYVSTDGEDWTTVPLPTLTYSNVTPRIAFYDGDFYILRPNQPVGRTGVTSWFLRRRASTIPAIGDPIIPSTWSSFQLTAAGVVVPEGFNTFNYPANAPYLISRNRAETLVVAGAPAGLVQVAPGDFIYPASGVFSGCSFTYELLPRVTLTWGAGGMASDTQVDLQPYIDQGYTKATYMETSTTSASALNVVTPNTNIALGSMYATSEGSFTLASIAAVGSIVRASYGSGGSVVLTLTEGTAPDWDGTSNNRREYLTPTLRNIDQTLSSPYTIPSAGSIIPYTLADIYAQGQGNGNEGGSGAGYVGYYYLTGKAIISWGFDDYGYYSETGTIPVMDGLNVEHRVFGSGGSIEVSLLKTVYGRRTYVENMIDVRLSPSNASYTVPAGITTCNYYVTFDPTTNSTYQIGLRKNGINATTLHSSSNATTSGVIAVAAGDVLTYYGSPAGATLGTVRLVLAGRGSFVDMTPISVSPATTMPAIGVAPVQAVPVIATVEEGENLGANYPIAKAVDTSDVLEVMDSFGTFMTPEGVSRVEVLVVVKAAYDFNTTATAQVTLRGALLRNSDMLFPIKSDTRKFRYLIPVKKGDAIAFTRDAAKFVGTVSVTFKTVPNDYPHHIGVGDRYYATADSSVPVKMKAFTHKVGASTSQTASLTLNGTNVGIGGLPQVTAGKSVGDLTVTSCIITTTKNLDCVALISDSQDFATFAAVIGTQKEV